MSILWLGCIWVRNRALQVLKIGENTCEKEFLKMRYHRQSWHIDMFCLFKGQVLPLILISISKTETGVEFGQVKNEYDRK